jgi:16S rRNA (uracil1498-N3)-methyltransferase
VSRIRLFCSRKRLEEGVFSITGEEAHHGVTVCRLKAGDEVFVFTEQGSEFRCEVVSARKGMLKAKIVEKLEDVVESPLQVTLVQALPKAAKLDEIIVRGTELGLGRLIPVRSERSFGGRERVDRWRRLALEAAKQSGRRIIPRIEPPVPLTELDMTQFTDSLRLLACEQPCAGSLRTLLDKKRDQKAVTIAVGPEGGYTVEEMRLFTAAGFLCVSMGHRTLRVETASPALIAALQYELGDWGVGTDSKPICAV